MIVTDIIKRADIPHETGEWIEFKRLSWRQLEMAGEVQSDAMLKKMKAMGGDLLAALKQTAEKEKQDVTMKYDKGTILKAGLVKWSYAEEITDENIEALDEQTAEWAVKEILSLNEPRTEEERKNA